MKRIFIGLKDGRVFATAASSVNDAYLNIGVILNGVRADDAGNVDLDFLGELPSLDKLQLYPARPIERDPPSSSNPGEANALHIPQESRTRQWREHRRHLHRARRSGPQVDALLLALNGVHLSEDIAEEADDYLRRQPPVEDDLEPES